MHIYIFGILGFASCHFFFFLSRSLVSDSGSFRTHLLLQSGSWAQHWHYRRQVVSLHGRRWSTSSLEQCGEPSPSHDRKFREELSTPWPANVIPLGLVYRIRYTSAWARRPGRSSVRRPSRWLACGDLTAGLVIDTSECPHFAHHTSLEGRKPLAVLKVSGVGVGRQMYARHSSRIPSASVLDNEVLSSRAGKMQSPWC